jgi:hypothetical protein
MSPVPAARSFNIPSLLTAALVAVLATTGSGCQKVSDMKAAAEAATQAFEDVQTATSSEEAGQKMGTAFNKLREAVGGGQAVQAVDFRQLQAVLPATVPGLTQADVRGERGSQMGFSTSKAEGLYTADGEARQRLTIVVTDLGSMSGVGALQNRLNAWGTSESQSTRGYERSATIRGYDGQETFRTYEQGGSHGTLSLLVAGRFRVEVEGRNVPMDVMQTATEGIDLDALAAMKDRGVGVDDGAGARVAEMYEDFHRAEQQKAASDGSGEVPRPQVVDASELEALLPTEAAGLSRATVTSRVQTAGAAAVAQAEARYEDGGRWLTLRLTDYAEAMAGGVVPGASWMLFDTHREHEAGYEKTTSIDGFPAREVLRRRAASTRCEVEVVVGQRFFLAVEAEGVTMDEVKAVLGQVGLDRIEALGKVPA